MVRRLLPLVALLFAAGCVPVTTPLSEPSKAEPDKRLVGKWEDGSRVVEIDIPKVKGNPKGLMRVVQDGKRDDQNTFWFFGTTVGKHSYATIYLASDKELRFADFRKEGAFEKYNKDKGQSYFIFKYTIDGDKLVVDGGDRKSFEMLMKDEKIDPSKDGLGFYETPKGWLAKYLEKTGPAKLFDGSNTQKFQRAKK